MMNNGNASFNELLLLLSLSDELIARTAVLQLRGGACRYTIRASTSACKARTIEHTMLLHTWDVGSSLVSQGLTLTTLALRDPGPLAVAGSLAHAGTKSLLLLLQA